MKKHKTFVITVSKNFLGKHPKKGEPTNFKDLILQRRKIHTIRGNFPYWNRIVGEVNAGNGILSVRQWQGKPYRSPQEEIAEFTQLGIQKIEIDKYENEIKIDGKSTNHYYDHIAAADGLNIIDFWNWFDSKKKFEGCIIHFTDFKYDL